SAPPELGTMRQSRYKHSAPPELGTMRQSSLQTFSSSGAGNNASIVPTDIQLLRSWEQCVNRPYRHSARPELRTMGQSRYRHSAPPELGTMRYWRRPPTWVEGIGWSDLSG